MLENGESIWLIVAKVSTRSGAVTRTWDRYLSMDYLSNSYCWRTQAVGAYMFNGTRAGAERILLKLDSSKEQVRGMNQDDIFLIEAAKDLHFQGFDIISIDLVEVTLTPVHSWEIYSGKPVNGKVLDTIKSLWGDAYACFKAVMDTPIARRKAIGEFAEESRQAMSKIDKIVNPDKTDRL